VSNNLNINITVHSIREYNIVYINTGMYNQTIDEVI
jgi:hypothetical protein